MGIYLLEDTCVRKDTEKVITMTRNNMYIKVESNHNPCEYHTRLQCLNI